MKNEFRISEVLPGTALLVGDVAVFSVKGGFCATQAKCTHRQGLLNKAHRRLDGDLPVARRAIQRRTGAVLRGPAKDPLKTYRVTVDGEVGRVDVPLAHAVQGA